MIVKQAGRQYRESLLLDHIHCQQRDKLIRVQVDALNKSPTQPEGNRQNEKEYEVVQFCLFSHQSLKTRGQGEG